MKAQTGTLRRVALVVIFLAGVQLECSAQAPAPSAVPLAGERMINATGSGDDIAAVSSADGRLEAFFLAVAHDGGVYHSWQHERNSATPSNIGSWSSWTRMVPAPDGTSQIVAARDSQGRLFAGWISDGSIWYTYQRRPNQGLEAPSRIDTHDLHGLTLATNKDGRIELFALSSNGTAWSTSQTALGSWTWSNRPIGGSGLAAIVPAPYFDGRLALVAIGGDSRVYLTAQAGPGLDWLAWTGLQGENIAQVAAAANADGRLNVAVIGGDGRFYERSQDQVDQEGFGGWSDWRYRAEGPFLGPLKLRQNADGRLEAFMRRADRRIVSIWQKRPNGSWVDDVTTLPLSQCDGFDVTMLSDGRLAATGFHAFVPAALDAHAETVFDISSQVSPNGSWKVSSAPRGLFPKPPSIAISKFQAVPDYVDQGSPSDLQWTLTREGTCVAADLSLSRKVFGEPETQILQETSPASSGSKSVVPAVSTPVRYRLAVSCKGLPGTRVTEEIPVTFGPPQTPPAPNVVVYGPIIDPRPVHEGEPFSVTWLIENGGTAESTSFEADLFLDDIKEADSKPIPKLAAGMSTSLTWNILKEIVGYTHKLELKDNGRSLGFGQFTVEP